MMRARRRLIGVAVIVVAAVLLAGCAFAPPATRTPDPALASLATELAAVDGVQDAVATFSYDGSPTIKRLNVRIYLREPANGDLSAITTETLRKAWNFTGFEPSAYSFQVWNGPKQLPPYDYSKRVDLTTVFPQLDLPDSRVYKSDLYVSSADLKAKFGPRK